MGKFYIEKLIVSGVGKEPSIVDFKDGTNFIIGPSNTGKTTIVKCIDYLFGFKSSKEKPFVFDGDGYSRFSLTIRTVNGTVVLTRKLEESSVAVSGTDNNFENGEYSVNPNTKRNLNSILLQLMGIGDEHKILAKLSGKPQQVTLRSMLHMFLLKQNDISRESSVLLNSKTWYNDTASKALMLFLMSGRDAEKKDTDEDKQIRKAKRTAVIAYIRDSVGELVKRESELLKLRNDGESSIGETIVTIKDEIADLQSQINAAIAKSKILMEDIFKHNSKLAECGVISQRFSELKSQYHADVERLTFIIEGRISQEGLPVNNTCPFCEGKITDAQDTSYVEAARSELLHVRTHLIDLQKAESDVTAESTALQNAVATLESEKRAIDSLVSKDLTPRINTLNGKLDEYRRAVELTKELELIQREEKRLSDEVTIMENAKDAPNQRHDILQHFDDEQLIAFSDKLRAILAACQYEGSASARFDLKGSFDLEVGGKTKAAVAGGGYCGFLNTIVALSLIEFLEEDGAYSPGFLIADSPLSQLSEPDDDTQLINKKTGFFNYLMASRPKQDTSDFRPQIIIAEHPEKLPFFLEGSENANVIEFTGDKKKGRYGFLNEVFNVE